MHAYKAMSVGARILNLQTVLKHGGVTQGQHLPKFAVARADWKHCWFNIESGRAIFSREQYGYSRGWGSSLKFKRDQALVVDRETFPAETTNTHWRTENKLQRYPIKSIVPSVPVHLRPLDVDLSRFCILWEVTWDLSPPADPFLLRQISDHFFVVVAQWDLTLLEQSVLELRV
jgi:hypothetical protein